MINWIPLLKEHLKKRDLANLWKTEMENMEILSNLYIDIFLNLLYYVAKEKSYET